MISPRLTQQVATEVQALVREAREAYDASYRFSLRILQIPEIQRGLELYEQEANGTTKRES